MEIVAQFYFLFCFVIFMIFVDCWDITEKHTSDSLFFYVCLYIAQTLQLEKMTLEVYSTQKEAFEKAKKTIEGMENFIPHRYLNKTYSLIKELENETESN